MLTAAVAVDLAESLETRESASGIRVLDDSLEAFRSDKARTRPVSRDTMYIWGL